MTVSAVIVSLHELRGVGSVPWPSAIGASMLPFSRTLFAISWSCCTVAMPPIVVPASLSALIMRIIGAPLRTTSTGAIFVAAVFARSTLICAAVAAAVLVGAMFTFGARTMRSLLTPMRPPLVAGACPIAIRTWFALRLPLGRNTNRKQRVVLGVRIVLPVMIFVMTFAITVPTIRPSMSAGPPAIFATATVAATAPMAVGVARRPRCRLMMRSACRHWYGFSADVIDDFDFLFHQTFDRHDFLAL